MTEIRAYAHRTFSLAVTLVAAASVAVCLAMLLGAGLGYRVLVVRSDSMWPQLRTGDLILTKLQRPNAVLPGDIVTFADHTRAYRLVTHRVVERENIDGQVNFVTKGDANEGLEHWTIPAGGRLGQLQWQVPRVGVALGAFTAPWTRLAMLATLIGMAVTLALRRIWAW